jgi:hypothetical protein
MNLGLSFQSDHSATVEWVNLRTAVARKDRPENDCLLIMAGAPDQFGRCFQSEEVLAHFLLDNSEPLTSIYLSSVVLHFWSTGEAFELLGEQPKRLWPAMYKGFSPPAHPFVDGQAVEADA